MKLYDEGIKNWNALLEGHEVKSLDPAQAAAWEDAGRNNMILRSDMAYELGGFEMPLPALGRTVITSDPSLVAKDEICLLGPDLNEITEETPYARLTVALVDEEQMGEGDALYNAIRDIEYVRYHVNPKGFMMRVSASHNRESVRVSKEALAQGLNFAAVGKTFIDTLRQNKRVLGAKVIFITDPSFDYEALEKELKKAEAITKTIDHVFKDLKMDCNICNLKQVCDEVEGLRELHFKNVEEYS